MFFLVGCAPKIQKKNLPSSGSYMGHKNPCPKRHKAQSQVENEPALKWAVQKEKERRSTMKGQTNL
jgi:hypothetical protein